MDIVIPLGVSKIDYLDLRYVLRSIEQFAKNVGEIYIIGEKPNWITGVKHIVATDTPLSEYKEQNIFLKTSLAFNYTDRFLFTNDDHVLLAPVDLETYPNYYSGTCYESMLRNDGTYRATMNQTKKWLELKGYPDRNYDMHCPAIFERERFMETVYTANWEVEFGYGMKSIYCAGLDGVPMADCKLQQPISLEQAAEACKGKHVVSFTDAAIRTGLKDYFDIILNIKSKYEK